MFNIEDPVEAVITQIVKTLDNNSDPPSIEEVEMAQYSKAKKMEKQRHRSD